MRATAVSTSQAALASTRIAPAGPRASRTASTRARSSAADCPGSATFTFAVRQPDAETIACARSGVDRRHGHVHRHRRPHRAPASPRRRLDRGGPPAAALGDVVVPERGELAPAGRAAHQDAVADVDAAEAGAQRHPVDPRLQRRSRRRAVHAAGAVITPDSVVRRPP